MSAHPSRRVRARATWLAVDPLVTVVLAVTRPVLDVAPLPLQTLVLTAVVVPVAVLWAVPLLLRLLTGAVPVRAADPHPTTAQEDQA